ncbi:EAL domain-containing protein [Almyronema epifaneia]|uniref:EAL domain-containing protein n=1 Tax=Almyronema epifaneia S1 TaxID=2991925 RepID=A0ABW6ILB5_9CYAN
MMFKALVADQPIYYQLLQSIQQAISEAADFDSALRQILQQVCDFSDWEFGEFWLPNDAKTALVHSKIWYAAASELQPFGQFSQHCQYSVGVGLPGWVWQSQQLEWIQDVSVLPKSQFKRAKLALAVGLKTGVGIPIAFNGEPLAVLVLFARQVCSANQQQVQLVAAIAAQLGAITRLKQIQVALIESQRQLNQLIDTLPGIVFKTTNDRAWSMRYLRGNCLQVTGYSCEALMANCSELSYNAITHVEDLPRILQVIQTAIAQQQPYEVEYRICTQSGQQKWVWEKGTAILSDTGEILGVEGLITDITERKRVEKALKERENLLQLVLNNIPHQISWKDQNSHYLGCNRAFAEAVGLASPQAIVGRDDSAIPVYSEADADFSRSRDRLILEAYQPKLRSLEQQVHAPGSQRWVDCSKLPIHDSDGSIIGVLGIFEDVTEQLLSQQALAQREQYMTALVDIQRQLLSLKRPPTWQGYQSLLKPLGIAAAASRVCLYHFKADANGEPVAVQQAEWLAPAMIAQQPEQPAAPAVFQAALFKSWLERLQSGYAINQTCHDFTAEQYQVLTASSKQILSLLLLPLLLEGELYGLIGFNNCREAKLWQISEVEFLRSAAAAFSLAYERWQAEAHLKQAEAKYRSIFENAVEGIFQSTLQGQYLTVNPMMAKLYGYETPAELISQITDISRQLYVDQQRRQEFHQQIQQQGSVIGFESQVYRKDGSIIWISESARAIYCSAGDIIGYEGTVENITARKQAEAELYRRDRLLQGVADASYCLLTNLDLPQTIPTVLAILGKAAAADRVYLYENHPHPTTGEVAMSMRFEWTRLGIAPTIHQPHWHNQPYHTAGLSRWYKAFSQGQSICGLVATFSAVEQKLLTKDQILSLLMVPIFVKEGLWGYIGFDACSEARHWTRNDESILVAIAASIGGAIQRQQTEEKMRYQAFHDPLTGLPNRMLFNRRLQAAIAASCQAQDLLAVMFLDLDRFKTINDTLGHAVGDRLLKEATQRLTTVLRSEDIIARWGGDEFTLLLPRLPNASQAAQVAQRLLDVLKPPFFLEDQELHITSSVGIALYPQDGVDTEALVKNADAAMYRAKEQGRDRYQFYTATIHVQASQRLTLENSLHHALERNEFILHYQPQVNLVTGKLGRIEALLRWQHPQLGLVPPQVFVPIAEENGLIIPIGEWVLETACRQVKRWQAEMGETLQIAVNLSPCQLQTPSLLETINRIMQTTGLAPSSLELEVTETAAMQDIDRTIMILNRLRQQGVQVVMDDFGTGYSSLSYLKKLPLDGLKIDRSFVQELADSADDLAMIAAMIALGKALNLTVVAEGVETLQQVQQLRSLDCQELQGNWFSPPLAAFPMTQFLTTYQLLPDEIS